MPRYNTESDFWSRVDKSNGDDSCWEWLRSKSPSGYGKVFFYGKDWRSHRLAFKLTYGHLPEFVCHRCDNPPCCNPRHLFGGSPKDNTHDMIRKGRKARLLGENHQNSKITKEQVVSIRAERRGGRSYADLGRKYGISPGHAKDICVFRRWSWLQ